MQAVFCLAHRCTCAVDVGQTEEIDDLSAPQILDRLTRRRDRTARLACDDDGVDAEIFARVEPLLLRFLAKRPSVGRGRPDNGRLILLQHEQQAIGRHRTNPDGERAEFLRTHNVGAADVERKV